MDLKSEQITRRKVLNATAVGTAAAVNLIETQSTRAAEYSGQAQTGLWPMRQGDIRSTSYVSADDAPDPETLSLDWTTDIGVGEPLSPVIGESGVVASTGRPEIRAVSLNPKTGKKRWEETRDHYTYAAPVAGEQRVYFAFDSKVSARSERGETADTEVSDYRFVDLIPTEGYVLYVTETGSLGAINEQGSVDWSFEVEYPDYPTKVAATNSTAYLATSRYLTTDRDCKEAGSVYAIDLESGQETWETSLPAGASELSIADGTIVVGTDDAVHGLDRETGSLVWDLGSQTQNRWFAIRNDLAVVGGYRHFAVVDVSSGDVEWKQQFDSRNVRPAVSDENIYVVGSGERKTNFDAQIATFDWHGNQAAQFDLDEEQIAGPAIANGSLVVSAESGTVHSFKGA